MRITKPEFINFHYLIGVLFIFFALLPYVNFGLNSRDSQPWAFLFATIFILYNYRYKLDMTNFAYFLIPIIASFVWFFFSSVVLDFISIRAMINYATFSFCLIGFIYFLNEYGFPWKLFMVVNFLYIVVAILQFYYPDIVSSIVTQRGTRESGRGVQSLAAEPTAFGLVLFFFTFIYLAASNFKPSRVISYFIGLNIFSIIFLAGSSTVILYLLVAAFISFFWLNFRLKLILLISIFIIAFIAYQYLEGSRILFIVNNLIERGLSQYIFFDESVNDRLAHVIFSIQGSFMNNLLPGGFNSFIETQLFLMKEYEGFFYYPNFTYSILSFFGTFVYELGFLGYMIFIYLFFHSQDGTLVRFTTVGYLFVVLNSGIPVSFPFVAILFGILIQFNYSKSHNSISLSG
tara:strand:+ start:3908 stop:5116 length:1209 start_codon:yes stop_codon:yes gene_type:complete